MPLLIVLGVTSFGRIATLLPWLDPVMRYGGAAFLIVYGAKSLRSALRSTEALKAEGATAKGGLFGTVLACLAITWLNPHVYLDTVVLLGTVSTQFPGATVSFAAGAIAGSFLFFFALGYGAAWLRPVFARPSAWRLLEGAIAAGHVGDRAEARRRRLRRRSCPRSREAGMYLPEHFKEVSAAEIARSWRRRRWPASWRRRMRG